MRILASFALVTFAFVASAQQAEVVIEATELATGVYTLKGRGGNLLLCSGEDGSFLVDDQYAPLSAKIQAKIEELGAAPVKFVLNTHYHGDHTGGNENFGAAGAIVIAHDKVRTRMTESHQDEIFDRLIEAAPVANLPIVTFSESVRFHVNGEEIHAFHVAPAHTDGDSFVHLRRANVLHMGDVFFNGQYPFIDVSGGGRVSGTISDCELALSLCDENTKIVPGHGAVGGKAELIAYRDMLKDLQAKIAAAIDAGKDLATLSAERPSAAYDERWGAAWVKGEQIVKMVYLSEQRDRAERK